MRGTGGGTLGKGIAEPSSGTARSPVGLSGKAQPGRVVILALRRVIEKNVGSSSALAQPSILSGDRGGPDVSEGAGRTCQSFGPR